ncbi:cadherin-like and PC-esterase domain-containing protein 1, partial [Dinothrombium tinctorium]
MAAIVLLKHPLTPLCFVFPQQYQQFLDVADALGYSAEWILKPVSVGGRLSGNGLQIVNIFTNEGREKLKEYSYKRAVVQQLIPNPLLIFGSPINLRVYVLITSIAPLRAFVHSEGLVYHRFDATKNYKKITGRTWVLSYFWQFVAKNFGESSVKKATQNIHRALVQLLLVAEAMLVTQSNFRDEFNVVNDEWTIIKRCTTCFQLIAVDLMLNSTFDPFILEVSSQPNMQEGSKEEVHVLNKVKKVVLDDFVNLITARSEVASDVIDALEEILVENSIGVMGISCLISHELCLSRDDFAFLLQTRRETLNKGAFRKLYPDIGTEAQKELIDELGVKIIGNSVNNDLSFHKTADLHPLLIALERFYNRHHLHDKHFDLITDSTSDFNAKKS